MPSYESCFSVPLPRYGYRSESLVWEKQLLDTVRSNHGRPSRTQSSHELWGGLWKHQLRWHLHGSLCASRSQSQPSPALHFPTVPSSVSLMVCLSFDATKSGQKNSACYLKCTIRCRSENAVCNRTTPAGRWEGRQGPWKSHQTPGFCVLLKRWLGKTKFIV